MTTTLIGLWESLLPEISAARPVNPLNDGRRATWHDTITSVRPENYKSSTAQGVPQPRKSILKPP
eukprot:5907480-Prymnesium_polylepis.1